MTVHTRLSRGMTLMELIVSIAILAILVAIGVPSMREWMVSHRVQSTAAELLNDLQYVRSEAVKRNTQTRISFKAHHNCYTLQYGYVSTASVPMSDDDLNCDCTATPGNACAGKAYTELKTVQLPDSDGVSIDSSGTPKFAPSMALSDTYSGGAVTVTISGGGSKNLIVTTTALMQRPAICAPTRSSISGFSPC